MRKKGEQSVSVGDIASLYTRRKMVFAIQPTMLLMTIHPTRTDE
jgi:hypothetical protein